MIAASGSPRLAPRPTKATTALSAPPGSSKVSSVKGRIHHGAEQLLDLDTLPRSLDQHQREHLFERVDEKQGSGNAAPAVGADRAGDRGDAGRQPDRKAESEAVPRRQQIADARNRAEMVAG